MKTNFTKGKWVLKISANALADTGDYTGSFTVENEQGHCICEYFSHKSIDEDQQEANARLGSAAPLLLQALLKVKEDYTLNLTLSTNKLINDAISAAIGSADSACPRCSKIVDGLDYNCPDCNGIGFIES